MGLILDTSLLIADERGKFDMAGFLGQYPEDQPQIASITASELLHGVERANDQNQRERRRKYVEGILGAILTLPFDLAQARTHARIWAELVSQGQVIGAHDLLIAAAGLALNHRVATLNVKEFVRVNGLSVIDATAFRVN